MPLGDYVHQIINPDLHVAKPLILIRIIMFVHNEITE